MINSINTTCEAFDRGKARSTAEDVSRPPRSSASDLVDYERRLIDEIKWHIEQASTKLDALSKLKRKW